MHDHGSAQLEPPDLAQLNLIAESRKQEWGRGRASEIARPDARYDKEQRSAKHNDPKRSPPAYTAQRDGRVAGAHSGFPMGAVDVETHECRYQGDQVQKERYGECDIDRKG